MGCPTPSQVQRQPWKLEVIKLGELLLEGGLPRLPERWLVVFAGSGVTKGELRGPEHWHTGSPHFGQLLPNIGRSQTSWVLTYRTAPKQLKLLACCSWKSARYFRPMLLQIGLATLHLQALLV